MLVSNCRPGLLTARVGNLSHCRFWSFMLTQGKGWWVSTVHFTIYICLV